MMRRPALRNLGIALLLILAAHPMLACPVCYGDTNSASGKSLSNAVYFLLAIIALVQVGFVALFYTFWKRAKNIRKTKESFRLIQGSAR